jgi:transposase
LDNNVVELSLKRAIRHRNNSLFYRSERGAEVGDMFMSLIYAAELHGESPFDYPTTLQLHAAAVADNPEAWLRWTYRATAAAITEARHAHAA